MRKLFSFIMWMGLSLGLLPLQAQTPAVRCNTSTPVQLQPTNVVRAVPRTGFNVNSATKPSWRNVGFRDSVRALAPQVIRYPGGTISQYWDWQRGQVVAPRNWRVNGGQLQSHFSLTTQTFPPHRLEDLKFAVDQLGVDVVFCLNLVSRDLQDQLAMLRRARQLDIPVRYVELGNELYLPEADYQQAYPQPDDYARDMNRWIQAIRADFPNVQIAVVGASEAATTSNNTAVPARVRFWNDAIYRHTQGYDALTIHQYVNPNAQPTASNLAQVFGRPFQDWQVLRTTTLDSLVPGKQVWFTEYNITDNRLKSTWGHGLYTAALTLRHLEDSRVSMSLNHQLTGRAEFASLNSTQDSTRNEITAEGNAMRLINRAVRGMNLARRIQFQNNPTLGGPANAYPALTSWLFEDSQGRRTAIVLNLDNRCFRVQANAFGPAPFRFEQISAGDVLQNNIRTHQLRIARGQNAGALDFPGYSLSLIEFEQNVNCDIMPDFQVRGDLQPGSQITFENQTFPADPTFTYDWSFGNGTGSTSREPVIVFDRPGTYPVTLVVRDARGCSRQVTRVITIQGPVTDCRPPQNLRTTVNSTQAASFSWDPAAGAQGYNVAYREVGSNAWNTVRVNTSSFSVNTLSADREYEVRVQTLCTNSISSPYTPERRFRTPYTGACVLPQEFSVVNLTDRSARLNWTAVPGAVNYVIAWRPENTNNWISRTVNGNSFEILNLNPETTYEYYIEVVCVERRTGYSAARTFRTLPAQPRCTAVQNIRLDQVSATSANVSWDASPLALGYTVEWRIEGDPNWQSRRVIATSATIDGLTERTRYEVRILSRCDDVTEIPSRVERFDTPGRILCDPPASTQVNRVDEQSAEIAWPPVANATGYRLHYREVTSANSPWQSVSVNATRFTLQNLRPDTEYEIYLVTQCDGRVSPQSPIRRIRTQPPVVVCPVPRDIIVSVQTSTEVEVTWAPVAQVSGYIVRYREVNTPNAAWRSLTVNANTVRLSALRVHVDYEVSVQAVCGNQTSGFSPGQRFRSGSVPTCDTPQNLRVDGTGQTAAGLAWDAVNGATGYVINYRQAGSQAWNSRTTIGTALTLGNLQPGTNYEIRVLAQCGNGTASTPGPIQAITTLASNDCPTPSRLRVQAQTATGTQLTWDAVSNAVQYRVEYRGANQSAWSQLTVTSHTAQLSNLAADREYEFRVQTVCGNAASSPFAQPVRFRTPPQTTCAPVNELRPDGVTDTEATIRWQPVSSASGYIVEYRAVNTNNWQRELVFSPEIILPGLQGSTEYEVRVTTFCQDQLSPDQPSLRFRTPNTPVAGCDAPVDLRVSDVGPRSARLNWQVNNVASAYNVRYRAAGSNVAWTTLSTADNTFELNTLQADREYEFSVQTVCGPQNLTSSWTAPQRFRTAVDPVCPFPADIVVLNASTTNARISWAPIPGAVSYNIRYRAVNSNTSYNTSTSRFTATLNYLQANTEYEVWIQTVCQGRVSDFSSPFLIRTPASNSRQAQEVQTTSFGVYPNPTRGMATLTWTLTETAPIQVSLTNLQGQVVLRQTVDVKPGQTETQLNLQGLPAGLYLLQAQGDSLNQTIKLSVRP